MVLEIAANENGKLALALALASWTEGEENARQKAIVQARKYYDGEQTAYLSARLKEILTPGNTPANVDQFLHLNVSDKVVTALTDRMSVTGFTSSDGDGDKSFAAWAWKQWQANRLDANSAAIFDGALTSGEHFVFVDLDNDNAVRFSAHERYCDPTNGGSGFGCKAFYPNDDETKPMTYCAKRWIEQWTNAQGIIESRQRMTLYYPDHFERYALKRGRWELTREFVKNESGVIVPEPVDERGFVPWVRADSSPLGIPIIHFRNRGRKCEIDDTVVAQQNIINHSLVNLVAADDYHGFPVWLFFGFYPTSDGKDLKSDGSNRLKIEPNSVIGTTKSRGDVDARREPSVDPSNMMKVINQAIAWLALAKDIPASRFQIFSQIPAADTQKELEAPMLARISAIETIFGDAWEDCMIMARRLANEFAGATMDETATIETQWAALTVRSDDRDNPIPFWQAAAAAVAAGVPIESYLRRNGWTDADIGTIYEAMPNDQLAGAGAAAQ